MIRIPNSELVAVAWVRSLAPLVDDLVSDASATLPSQERWTKPVYVQVTAIGGAVSKYHPLRGPVVQVDCWAAAGMWGEVMAAAEYLRDATYAGEGTGQLVVKTGFKLVNLGEVSVENEPRPIRGDPAALARAQIDLQFVYVVLDS